MVAVGERGKEIAEHMRGSREAMQQKNRWRCGRSRFAIENPVAVNDGIRVPDPCVCPGGRKPDRRVGAQQRFRLPTTFDSLTDKRLHWRWNIWVLAFKAQQTNPNGRRGFFLL